MTKNSFVAEVTFKSIKRLKIQRLKSPDSDKERSTLVLTKRIKLKNINMKKKTIVYLTFNLVSQYLLISRLSFCMLDLVLQNEHYNYTLSK